MYYVMWYTRKIIQIYKVYFMFNVFILSSSAKLVTAKLAKRSPTKSIKKNVTFTRKVTYKIYLKACDLGHVPERSPTTNMCLK